MLYSENRLGNVHHCLVSMDYIMDLHRLGVELLGLSWHDRPMDVSNTLNRYNGLHEPLASLLSEFHLHKRKPRLFHAISNDDDG